MALKVLIVTLDTLSRASLSLNEGIFAPLWKFRFSVNAMFHEFFFLHFLFVISNKLALSSQKPRIMQDLVVAGWHISCAISYCIDTCRQA